MQSLLHLAQQQVWTMAVGCSSLSGETMSITTRLDGRSVKNSYFHLVDKGGFILATVAAKKGQTELEIRTAPHLHIEKANGYRSNMNETNE